jgi:hypothetical protein
VQLLEEDLLGHSLDLNEDVIQDDLGLVSLEVVLLRVAVVGAQDVDLRILSQPFDCVSVLSVEVAQVIEGELAGEPTLL